MRSRSNVYKYKDMDNKSKLGWTINCVPGVGLGGLAPAPLIRSRYTLYFAFAEDTDMMVTVASCGLLLLVLSTITSESSTMYSGGEAM